MKARRREAAFGTDAQVYADIADVVVNTGKVDPVTGTIKSPAAPTYSKVMKTLLVK